MQVKRCIICGKPAKIYLGHLHYSDTIEVCDSRDEECITAGFCSRECEKKAKEDKYCRGCVGVYKSKFGKMKE